MDDPKNCLPQITTRIIQIQAGVGASCDGAAGARRQEGLLDLPVRHALTLAQFRMPGHHASLGVQTWKFSNDLLVYTELIRE